MEKLKENLVIGIIIVASVGLYFAMPVIVRFVVANSYGTRGMVFWAIISAVFLLAYFLMGYRGKSLLYILLLILFIAAGFWLYFNYRSIDTFISSRYGQLAATAVFVLIVLVIFLFTKFIL